MAACALQVPVLHLWGLSGCSWLPWVTSFLSVGLGGSMCAAVSHSSLPPVDLSGGVCTALSRFFNLSVGWSLVAERVLQFSVLRLEVTCCWMKCLQVSVTHSSPLGGSGIKRVHCNFQFRSSTRRLVLRATVPYTFSFPRSLRLDIVGRQRVRCSFPFVASLIVGWGFGDSVRAAISHGFISLCL